MPRRRRRQRHSRTSSRKSSRRTPTPPSANARIRSIPQPGRLPARRPGANLRGSSRRHRSAGVKRRSPPDTRATNLLQPHERYGRRTEEHPGDGKRIEAHPGQPAACGVFVLAVAWALRRQDVRCHRRGRGRPHARRHALRLGFGLLYQNQPKLLRARYVLPAELTAIEDYDDRYLSMAAFGVSESRVTVAAMPNSSTLLRLLDIVNQRADELLCTVADGLLPSGVPPEISARSSPGQDARRSLAGSGTPMESSATPTFGRGSPDW